MKRITFLLCAGLALSAAADAAIITADELPAEIQTCHYAGTCTVYLASGQDVFNTAGATDYAGHVDPYVMSAFLMSNGDLLFRYNLVVPSVRQYEDIVQPTDGSVWLRASSSYDTNAGPAQMTLYFDQVDPAIDYSRVVVELGADALLAGSGYTRAGCCEEPSEAGNMSASFDGYGLPLCVAEGCYASAGLNLLYLVYTDPDGDGIAQLGFDLEDTRGLLFRTRSYDPYGGMEYEGSASMTELFVAPVPVPAASWLFGSGLLLLARIRRVRAASASLDA